MRPLTSCIVVNWNGARYISECIDALHSQTHRSFEVLVVDNGSTDDSQQILQNTKGITLIRNEENRGFGTANNQAILRSRGDFIAFVNNDAVLEPTWLERMVASFDDPRVGMAAGKTLSYFDRDRIDNTGHLLFWDGVNRGRGRMQKDCGQFDGMSTALFPSGCASMFRASMLQQIGLFDEEFFLYGDDTDLGLRARLAGWECAFVPAAIAYHRYSASTSSYDSIKFFFVERNRFWVALKYFPAELLLLNPFFSFARWFFHFAALVRNKGVSGEFAREKPPQELLRLWWSAQVSAWKQAPEFLHKRRELQKQFHWTRSRFYKCFLPNRISLRELTFTP